MNGNNMKWYYVLRGLIALLFGIAAIVWPAVVLEFLVYFFGFFAIIISAFALVAGAAAPELAGAPRWSVILLSIIGILIGIFALVFPEQFTALVIIIIALWAIVTGIGDFIAAFAPAGRGTRLLFVLLGIVSVVFGGILLFYPLLGAVTIIFVLGIYAVIFGILGIIHGFTIGSGEVASPAV
jgi:uncharacterized membrane protein HdeD (DUF308 family)